MNFTPNDDLQSLAERAEQYRHEIESELERYRADDVDIIVGLDPKGKKYWAGETESSILEQRKKEGNINLVYFIKLTKKLRDGKLVVAV